jgi:hypothetical protein
MTFSVRHFLRQIHASLLETYFCAKTDLIPRESWKLKQPKLAAQLAEFLQQSTDPVCDTILADLVRVQPMATERGRKAILNAASSQSNVVETFSKLDNEETRALWMLMEHEAIFRAGEELHFFDFYSDGNRGRHYRTKPDLTVSRKTEDIRTFSDEICNFYRNRDGSGICCEVEFVDRHQDSSVQLTIYIQGLPNNGSEFVNRRYKRRVSNPAIEAAIVYDPADGQTSTVAKGGKDVHDALLHSFATKLLKVESRFDIVRQRKFTLDALKSKQTLLADPSLGIRAVRVRKLRMAPPRYSAGFLTVEAPAGEPDTDVYDLGNQWFAERAQLYEKFAVIHATIAMHFHPKPAATRSKTINIELTMPNTSNLKSFGDADRRIVEAHIEKWKLIEATG